MLCEGKAYEYIYRALLACLSLVRVRDGKLQSLLKETFNTWIRHRRVPPAMKPYTVYLER